MKMKFNTGGVVISVITLLIVSVFFLLLVLDTRRKEADKQAVDHKQAVGLASQIEQENSILLANYNLLLPLSQEMNKTAAVPVNNFLADLRTRIDPPKESPLKQAFKLTMSATDKYNEIEKRAKSVASPHKEKIEEALQQAQKNLTIHVRLAAKVMSQLIFAESGKEIFDLSQELFNKWQSLLKMQKQPLIKKEEVEKEEKAVASLIEKVETQAKAIQKKIDACPPGALGSDQKKEIATMLGLILSGTARPKEAIAKLKTMSR